MTISSLTLESCLIISNIFNTLIDLQCASPSEEECEKHRGVGHNGLIFAEFMSFFLVSF